MKTTKLKVGDKVLAVGGMTPKGEQGPLGPRYLIGDEVLTVEAVRIHRTVQVLVKGEDFLGEIYGWVSSRQITKRCKVKQ